MPGIRISKFLTQDQIVKVFSNPVSGISCNFGYIRGSPDYLVNWLKNIRYSKSMILGALSFWNELFCKNIVKLRKVYNPLVNFTDVIAKHTTDIADMYLKIASAPDSFLFSHRHIRSVIKNQREVNARRIFHSCSLLNDKYTELRGLCGFNLQQGTMQYFSTIQLKCGIEFTVFPNEYPTIIKQKITRVGRTAAGNVYVLHGPIHHKTKEKTVK